MRAINVSPPGTHKFMLNDAGETVYLTTQCHGGCGERFNLDDARVCAILICTTCRKDPKKLKAARAELAKHMRAHTIFERQTNPWYPYEDLENAWYAA